MKILFSTLFIMFFTICLYSQNYALNGIDTGEKIPKGLKVGDAAPDFRGINQQGKEIRLSDEWKKGKVVLIFYRGYWCGSCNKYLADYQDSLQMITSKGAKIIAVTPEQFEGVEKTIDKTGANFDIISDHDNEIMKKYKVDFKVTATHKTLVKIFTPANISENNHQEEAWLPVPATYIIGRDGVIEFVQFDPDYKDRASVKQIIRHL